MEEKRIKQFEKDLSSFGISLTKKQTDQFIRYYELLTDWNTRMNLTAITDFEEVCKKHFLDSLSIIKAYNPNREIAMIDIGSGAGFPGIPIKIAFPKCRLTLLDSLQKRVTFLNEVVKELQLEDVTVFHGRAEDYAKEGQLREQYDLCVSRAVANLSTLCELCIPYVKIGGDFIAYKSEKANEEMIQAKRAISILGGLDAACVSFRLPKTNYERNLLIIHKEKQTPEKYPRKAGIPVKKPL